MNYTQISTLPPARPQDVLAQTGFFGALNRQQLDVVAELCQWRVYEKGETIYRIGDPPDDFFVLGDGVVRFSLRLGHAKASAGEIIRCGEVFGWASLVESSRSRLANAHCLTPCRLLSINGDALLNVMEQDNRAGYVLMKKLNALISGNLSHFVAG